MKLYYSPGACSLASHIALREAGADFDIEKVDLGKKLTETGEDFRAINPKGYVPAMKMDNGEVLTEGVAMLQYIADQAPKSGLAPGPTSFERYRLQEWLNYITTEIHKGIGQFFSDDLKASSYAPAAHAKADTRLDYIEHQLKAQKSDYLMGEAFTVADAYLFTTLRWAPKNGFDLAKYPALKAYMSRVAARPAVKKALEAEGIA